MLGNTVLNPLRHVFKSATIFYGHFWLNYFDKPKLGCIIWEKFIKFGDFLNPINSKDMLKSFFRIHHL